MAALITAADLREHVETDLSDSALGRLIDDADAEIVRRFGAHTTAIVETFTPGPGETWIFPERRVDTVNDITETTLQSIGETVLTLDASDYAVESEGRQLRRKQNGLHGAQWWQGIVTVDYDPVADDARRTRVTIDLVRLALSYDATSSSNVGGISVSSVDYARERERILRVLTGATGLFA